MSTIPSIEYIFFVLPDENSIILYIPYSKPKWSCKRSLLLHSYITNIEKRKNIIICAKNTTCSLHNLKRTSKRKEEKTCKISHELSTTDHACNTTDHDNNSLGHTKLVVFYTDDLGHDSQSIENKIRARVKLYNDMLQRQGVTSKKAFVKLVLIWRLLPDEYKDWIGSQISDTSRQTFHQKMDSKRKLVDADIMMLVHNWYGNKNDSVRLQPISLDHTNTLKYRHSDLVIPKEEKTPELWEGLLSNNFELKKTDKKKRNNINKSDIQFKKMFLPKSHSKVATFRYLFLTVTIRNFKFVAR